MWQRVVTHEHDVEGRRSHRQRPEVGDQRDEWQATQGRFASGPSDRPGGEIRARDTEAPAEKTECLGSDAQRRIEHRTCVGAPAFADERPQGCALPAERRLPVFVYQVIERRQLVVERSY